MHAENLTPRPPAPADTREGLNRKSWTLWAMMSAVLIGLTVAVALLYMPILHGANAQVSPDLYAGAYFSLIGLAGLVVVFCLYTAFRHRELNRLRKQVAV